MAASISPSPMLSSPVIYSTGETETSTINELLCSEYDEKHWGDTFTDILREKKMGLIEYAYDKIIESGDRVEEKLKNILVKSFFAIFETPCLIANALRDLPHFSENSLVKGNFYKSFNVFLEPSEGFYDLDDAPVYPFVERPHGILSSFLHYFIIDVWAEQWFGINGGDEFSCSWFKVGSQLSPLIADTIVGNTITHKQHIDKTKKCPLLFIINTSERSNPPEEFLSPITEVLQKHDIYVAKIKTRHPLTNDVIPYKYIHRAIEDYAIKNPDDNRCLREHGFRRNPWAMSSFS